jgi:triacylglycerol lipase
LNRQPTTEITALRLVSHVKKLETKLTRNMNTARNAFHWHRKQVVIQHLFPTIILAFTLIVSASENQLSAGTLSSGTNTPVTQTDQKPPKKETNSKKLNEASRASSDLQKDGLKESKKIKVIRNETYKDGIGDAGLCDVFLPESIEPITALPVVILVHGGGWVSGNKRNLSSYAYQLAEAGIAAISINYRHAPKHRFPAQVDDVRDALIWANQNKERLQLDVSRLGMFGYSAGGHLTALVASIANESLEVRSRASHWKPNDPRWKQLPRIKAISIGGPPCDFRSLPPNNTSMAFFLGGSRQKLPDTYKSASPTAHVSKGDPPTQIIHGESDIMVPLTSSRNFHQAQKEVGLDSELVILPKQGHFLTFLNPITARKMVSHFEKHFKTSSG